MKKTLHRLRQLILIRRRRAFDQQDKHKIRYVLVRGGSGFALAISLIAVVAILLSAFAYTRLTSDLPALDQLPLLLNPETGLLQSPTRIYDRTGKVVIATLENPGITRHYVALDPDKPEHFSAYFISTMVSINEPNFWSSPGYSLSEWNNPKPVTITEKLVDSLLLETEPPGLRRSIRMRLLAAQLVNRYGRVQTLEWYLNSAYFGHLAYGADAAARLYFGKSVQEVNLAESAVLAAAALAPALNPIDAPKAAIEYQKSVLSAIHAAGFIPDSEYTQAIETTIEFTPADQVQALNQTAYIDLVLGQASALMGKQNIERGGLDIISTLDATLQTQVECVLRLQLSRIQAGETEITQKALTDCDAALFLSPLSQNTQSDIENVQGSAVILNLKTGEILALFGDLDSIGNEYEMQPHQAGSLLTPIVAVSAFSRGMSPATLVWDIPEMFSDSVNAFGDQDQQYHGPVRLRTAMANDYLLPIAQLIEQFGSSTIWQSTEPLGLTAFNKSYHGAEVLFGEDTFTILEVARIYSVFANLGTQNGRITPNGTSVEPASVLRIAAADGRVIFAPSARDSQSVLSAPIAYLVHSILADESARRAEYGHPNLLEIGKPAGAKVGTIASQQEAWTVGYTNTFLVASWIGINSPDTTTETIDFQTAAGVWNALIRFASQDDTGSDWEIPVGISQVDVCDPSGKLATAICPVVVTEYFLNGSEPSEYDTLYQQIQVNRETDRLATVFTPLELVQEQTFLVVPIEAKPWTIAQGIPQPPTEYDTIQAPPENPQVRITNPVMFDYVHGEVEVTGNAADDFFQSYSLQVGEGLNPSSWQEIGSGTSPIKEGKLGTWQTGQDGLYAMRLVVVGENQKLTTAIIQVSVDNTPPLARILYPVDGTSIAIADQQTIFFQVDIEENVKVDKIRWMIDEVQIAETSAENFSLSWKPEAGEHTLSITVIDIAGNSTTTIPVSFTVNR